MDQQKFQPANSRDEVEAREVDESRERISPQNIIVKHGDLGTRRCGLQALGYGAAETFCLHRLLLSFQV